MDLSNQNIQDVSLLPTISLSSNINSAFLQPQNHSFLLTDDRQRIDKYSNYNKQAIISQHEKQFQDIESKTLKIVMKQKQQRRQLKKLKKDYQLKIEECQIKEKTFQLQADAIKNKLKVIISQRQIIINEKNELKNMLKDLQEQFKINKIMQESILLQKNQFIRRIQLLEANFYEQLDQFSSQSCRLQQKSSKNNQESYIQKIIESKTQEEQIVHEIAQIDKLISQNLCVSQQSKDHELLNRLYSLKIAYLQKRQKLRLSNQQLKHNKKINQFNRIILNRNRLLDEFQNSRITNNLMTAKRNSLFDQSKVEAKFNCTGSTLFSSNYFEQSQDNLLSASLIIYQPEFQTKNQEINQEIKTEIRQSNSSQIALQSKISEMIKNQTLKGHEQVYNCIESLSLGLVHLFKNKKQDNQKDILYLIEYVLSQVNSKLVGKAKIKLQLIKEASKKAKFDCQKLGQGKYF